MINTHPALADEKQKCCGCTACMNSCPTSAIKMLSDNEGFLYPTIDENICINCGLCEKVCNFKNHFNNDSLKNRDIKVYALKHKNENTRNASMSGGAFTAFSDEILRNNGVVYGCALDENLQAVHIRAETNTDRNLMRGSKYVQSCLGDIFKKVKIDLESGKNVLFSGTACQIDGLKGYLRKDYKNLILLDIVCFGVPSPIVWRKYLDYCSKKYGKIKIAIFRDKANFGWKSNVSTIINENGKMFHNKVYARLFSGKLALRPSCYECPYKAINRFSDITIGDYWGIDNNYSDFNDNKGVSLVILNNKKGIEFFENIKDQVNFIETSIDNCMQPMLKGNFEKPASKMREQFWNDLINIPFYKIIKKYTKKNIKQKIKSLIRRIV